MPWLRSSVERPPVSEAQIYTCLPFPAASPSLSQGSLTRDFWQWLIPQDSSAVPPFSGTSHTAQLVIVPTSNGCSVLSTSFYLISFSPPLFSANPFSLLSPYTPNPPQHTLSTVSPLHTQHLSLCLPFNATTTTSHLLATAATPRCPPTQPHPTARVAQRGCQQPRGITCCSGD